jgi:hypothetical protein
MNMTDTKQTIHTSQIKNTTIAKEVFWGIALFVGMNYVFALGGFFLVNFFAGLDNTASTFLRDLSLKVVLGAAISINVAIFAYLVLRRPRMSLGIVAVIPALVLLWCAVILGLLFLMVILFVLQFVIWGIMILFVTVFPWVLLGLAIIFILWVIILGIGITLLVLRNFQEKARQKSG